MSFRSLYVTLVLVLFIPMWGNAQDSTRVTISCHTCDKVFIKDIPNKFLSHPEAERKLTQLLFNLQLAGYFEAESSSITTEEEMTIHIHPGKKYVWDRLDLMQLPEEILKYSGYEYQDFETGSFDFKRLRKIADQVISLSENNGYPFSSLAFSSVLVDDFKISANLTYDSGPLITFDSIQISTPETIKSSFLIPYLNILPGSPYNQLMVNQVEKRLANLPYISLKEQSISFQNEEATLHLDLEPVNANRFEGILGFAPNQTKEKGVLLTGQIDLLLQNLFRSGKTFGFQWRRLRAASQYLNVLYQHPRMFSTPLDGSFHINLLKQDSAFLNRNMNLSIGLDINSSTYIQFMTEYRFSNSISKEGGLQPVLPDLSWLSYGTTLRWGNVDHLYFPRRGTLANVKALIGNKKITGAVEPQKTIQAMLTARLENHQPVAPRFILYNELTSGFLFSKDVFMNELFQLGGLNNLRGFNENEFWVSNYLISTIEARYFFEDKSYFMTFYDQAFLNIPSVEKSLKNNPSGIGFGMSLQVKSGILKIIYAVGASKDQPFDLGSSKFHFGFETIF